MRFSKFALALPLIALCSPLSAATWEYRKCAIDAVFSGAGVPATTIPGSEFVGWARSGSGSASAKAINLLSKKCLSWALSRNAQTIPRGCENNPRALNNSEVRGRGLTAFSLTNGLSALKNAICANSRIGTNYARSRTDMQFDRRVIEGFRVSFRKRGGTGACRGEQFWQTQTLNLMCKASPDMLRLDRVPARLYRRDPNGANTSACKAQFAMREHGASTQEAKRKAVRAWVVQMTRQHGVGYADPRKSKAPDYKCVKRIQGRFPVSCVYTATPCYF